MLRARTTTSCRAFALIALLGAVCVTGLPAAARAAADDDRQRAPKLPLAEWWTVTLDGAVGAGPASDASRVYFALTTGDLIARDAADGHERWRVKKRVSAMLASGDLLFVAAPEAVEAIRGADGKGAWILPRTTPVAPLLVDGDTLFIVTQQELVAVRAATGEVIWRHAAGGVRLAPASDDGFVYTGADDGRVLALRRADGAQAWERFFPGGITALGAKHGLVYIGGGDGFLYCLHGGKKDSDNWTWRLGAIAIGRIAVDDDRVYVAARDNVIRGFDRGNGNMRWHQAVRERPTFGVTLSGNVIFVPASASAIAMLYARTGALSGTLTLPGDVPASLRPALLDTPDGAVIYAVSGGLTNEWHLTKFAPAGDTQLLPFSEMAGLPGLPYLTDPGLMPLVNVMQLLVAGDPPLRPLSEFGWPVVLRDPPLQPLTVLPGLQLRPLSPVLPVRRAGL